ncbi:uncharacterized protein LOC120163645 [Hibiscus syriacus]|uniref:uncharacterized protein LOC120163645 n=1 Tax=Hibiscus syriacus TaxID=106335 RepID=UPI00192118EA|nr:uncharacterized protein LOC120163645 [Hibiscus syriacus]
MRRLIIVQLLGRKNGYKTLMDRINQLWKPKGQFQVVDLDNDYYIVMFTNEDDYIRVLMDGPWMVYGNYLIVQPWSRTFSTAEMFPLQVIVWVRIPKLPYRYYSKALFRYIAAVIGKVVNLNKPLIPSIRIDGVVRQLEYEGLQ